MLFRINKGVGEEEKKKKGKKRS